MSSLETDFQVEDFDVELHGVRLRARRIVCAAADRQDKPPLVFLHDSWGCIELWRDFPRQVAAATSSTAVIYDRQGYGMSSPFSKARTPQYLEEEADILLEFLDFCGIEKAVLFGHSDGGSIALIAAAKSPERIAAVVSEGAHVFVEPVTLEGIAEGVELYRKTALPKRLERYHGAKTDAMFRAWSETWLSPEFRNWNIERYLPDVRCPTLVLQGVEDEYGTDSQVRAIATQVAGPVETCLVEGVGHTPHKDAAATTLRLVVDFLNRVNAGC